MQQLLFTILLLGFIKFSIAQDQSGYIKEGNTYFKKGQFAEAITSYNKVTEEKYKYTALLNKGIALYKLKKTEDAINNFTELSDSKNLNATMRSDAFYNKGVVYSNQDKIQESIEAYKNALRLNSKDAQARENLQKALSELKKSSGGGGGEQKPQTSPATLSQSQAQQQLNRLEQKERNTQKKLSNKKTQFSSSNGKDW